MNTMDRDNVDEEMVDEEGIAPQLEVDDDQRAELLREWHAEDAQRDAEKKQKG